MMPGAVGTVTQVNIQKLCRGGVRIGGFFICASLFICGVLIRVIFSSPT